MSAIIADASRVTPIQFFDSIFGTSPATREAQYQEDLDMLISRITRGDSLYGWPPLMIADARQKMKESMK